MSGLGWHHDGHAAVVGPALGGLVVCQWKLRAQAAKLQLGCAVAGQRQGFAHRLGPAQRELFVVRAGAQVVGVAINPQRLDVDRAQLPSELDDGRARCP